MTNDSAQQKSVVLHAADEPERVDRAVMVAGLIREERGELPIRIIVNGPALRRFADSAANPLQLPEGTTLDACARGLSVQQVSEDQLQPEFGTVASAALALIDAQHQGAAYIRV